MMRIGSTVPLFGDVTTLNWIDARQRGLIERHLGFGPGRLARGYHLAVLKALPLPSSFEFGGTTLNSGGRLGKPQATSAADRARVRIHDTIDGKRGGDGYRALQKQALAMASIIGPNRIVKVKPVIEHRDNVAPSTQYPMGGGGLQWKLLPPGLPFLVAMFVDAEGVADIPEGRFDLGPSAPYENRALVARWLQRA